MSSDEVNIIIKADTDEFKKEIYDTKKQADAVAAAWAQEHRKIQQQMQATVRVMRTVASTARSWLRLFGETIDPVFDTIIQSTLITLESILAIHRALEAATLGIAGVVTIAASSGAIILSGVAIALAQDGKTEAQQTIEDAGALMDSIQNLVDSIGGIL